MEPQNKLRMEIVKNGKVLKYVCTEASHSGLAGYFTDTYKDEDGNIHYIDRLSNAIKFTTHSRKTGDGNMISFSINFKLLIQNYQDGCNENELERNIKKCEYSLSKAQEGYKREDAENWNDNYVQAVFNKVDEVVDELTLKQPSPNMIVLLEELADVERMKENVALSNAIKTKAVVMKNAELDQEPEQTK